MKNTFDETAIVVVYWRGFVHLYNVCVFPQVYQHYEGFVLFSVNGTVVVYGSPTDIAMTDILIHSKP